jgi:hypothetical protein
VAISFVGSNTGTQASASSITVNLPAGLQENDVVYVWASCRVTNDRDMTENSGTWQELADLYSNDSADTNSFLGRKVMGASPDTTVQINAGTSTDWAAITYALRGVDTTTPEDATTTTATGFDTGRPNPPSITTVTDNAWVIAFGASANDVTATNAPTGYSNLAAIGNTGLTIGVAGSSKTKTPAGAEDPGIYTDFDTAATRSWSAATVAAKPAAGGSTYTLDADSATYAYTATAAGLEFDRLLNADAASYTYTATAVGLEFDRQLVADAASYAWTANDAALEYTPVGSTYTLDADSAAYLWSATDAGFTYVSLARDELKYGAAPDTLRRRRDYESQVRAHWERIEAAERAEQARRDRVAELQRQQAEVDAKAARASRSSAVAKRKAKLAREIDALQAEQERAADEVAEIRQLIAALEAEIADQRVMTDRRRRMFLLLAATAA